MKKTKIETFDCTINPVIGCKNYCEYCYAKKINDRFKFITDWHEPKFFPERLEQLKSKKPKSIFMNSMSDIGWWEEDWGQKVYNEMRKNPQHNYIFLTKGYHTYPCGMCTMWSLRDVFRNPNIFFGKTITNNRQFHCGERYDFLSIEPLLEPIDLSTLGYSLYTKQVIIGAETGNRKGKIIPKKEWVLDIVQNCDEHNIPVFMKESLRKIMGKDFRQDPLIWDVNNRR